ncbi:DNA polymerase III subunit delta [Dictyoglomus thermophilum]|uniref:DNA polymerase III subunit delta n=2 Tax=Dictyoglomus thermophilum TaxID=14 RepID=B5YE69_DICT6|nr:DNA polymerase III subunit delta [Dictyoglomus thermophilum]ACI20079.1 DNA polymerase III, delta subunit [Dictyoglomus thermophilum H-6-12]
MNYWEFKHSLKEKKFSPVYLFTGEEKFLMEEALIELRKARFKDANYVAFFADEITWDNIIPYLESPPLLGTQLVVVRHAQELKDQNMPKKLDLLFKKLTNTCVVFMANAEEEKPKKISYAKYIPPEGIVEFTKFRADALRKWIKEKFQERNKSIDEESVYFLSTNYSDKMGVLMQEIDKICAFVGEKESVTIEDLKKVLSTQEVAFYTFLDALLRRDFLLAFSGIDTLWNEGVYPQVILEIVIKQMRQLLRINALLKEGYSSEEIANKLDLHPFVVKKSIDALTKYTAAELMEIYFLLRQVDIEYKTTAKDQRILIEKVLLKLGRKVS